MVSKSVWGVVAVLTGAVAAVVVVGPRGVEPRTETGDDRVAVVAFLDRWEAWRRATASFTETTERVSGDRQMVEVATIAQRFPDRVVRSGTDVSARLDARLVGCTEASAASSPRCVDNGGYEPDRELQLELDEIADVIDGASPRYRVADRGGGCFRLRHMVDELRPYWGDRSDICFDEVSGVAVSEVTVTGSLTVSVERSAIRTTVTDDDFSLPAPIGVR